MNTEPLATADRQPQGGAHPAEVGVPVLGAGTSLGPLRGDRKVSQRCVSPGSTHWVCGGQRACVWTNPGNPQVPSASVTSGFCHRANSEAGRGWPHPQRGDQQLQGGGLVSPRVLHRNRARRTCAYLHVCVCTHVSERTGSCACGTDKSHLQLRDRRPREPRCGQSEGRSLDIREELPFGSHSKGETQNPRSGSHGRGGRDFLSEFLPHGPSSDETRPTHAEGAVCFTQSDADVVPSRSTLAGTRGVLPDQVSDALWLSDADR